MEVHSSDFGVADGQQCQSYTIKNANGMSISFTNWGATLTSVKTPSKTSKEAQEVTLVPGYPAATLDTLKVGSQLTKATIDEQR